ncbi:MAG: M50 family metallopeptidase [Candidatus Paceibacterota bacterium]
MSIIIFIAVLVLLILAHELGHFLVAKYFNIRADEFGIGLPPRLTTLFRWGETDFTLNAIPFGGFVKIYGEDPGEEPVKEEDQDRHFANKHRGIQAAVLLAGVFFNALLAFVLITIAFTVGVPTSGEMHDPDHIKDPKATISYVKENSPAENAGLQVGDVVSRIQIEDGEAISIATSRELSDLVNDEGGEELTIYYEREGVEKETSLVPQEDLLEKDGAAIGVALSTVGVVSFPPHLAFVEGAKHTVELTGIIAVELSRFLGSVVTGGADFSEVAGPVGIVGLVGDAWEVGLSFLLYFTAVISLHLTIINLLPFPALDGGRLLFVAIEAATRRKIKPQVANALNAIGFILLIILMIAVTTNDVIRIFS